MVRTVFILVVLAAAASMAGWFTIDRDETETTIRFNREEIREDASAALAKGREFLNNHDEVNQSFGEAREAVGEFVDQSGFVPQDAPTQQAHLPPAPWEQPLQRSGDGQQF